MQRFEQQFNFEESLEEKKGKEYKFEQALSPEAEIDFEKSKYVLAEIWPELTNSEKIEDEEIEGLTHIEYRKILYEKMKPALEETIKSLDISIDRESLNNPTDNNDLSEKQIKFIRSLEKQFKDVSVNGKLKEEKRSENTWNFYPKEIIKNQGVNCSGASLLFGYIAEESGIKTYQARTPNHAFNVLELANNELVFVDTRINTNDNNSDLKRVFIMDGKKQEFEDMEYVKIDSSKLGLLERLNNFLQSTNDKIMLLPQFEAVGSIINNFGSLKTEAAKAMLTKEAVELIDSLDGETFDHDPEAKEIAKNIYIENEEILSRVNFNGLYDNLCEDIIKKENKLFSKE